MLCVRFRSIQHLHECKHSTIVVASMRYPLHKLQVMCGFTVSRYTFGGILGIDKYSCLDFMSAMKTLNLTGLNVCVS